MRPATLVRNERAYPRSSLIVSGENLDAYEKVVARYDTADGSVTSELALRFNGDVITWYGGRDGVKFAGTYVKAPDVRSVVVLDEETFIYDRRPCAIRYVYLFEREHGDVYRLEGVIIHSIGVTLRFDDPDHEVYGDVHVVVHPYQVLWGEDWIDLAAFFEPLLDSPFAYYRRVRRYGTPVCSQDWIVSVWALLSLLIYYVREDADALAIAAILALGDEPCYMSVVRGSILAALGSRIYKRLTQ
jgi:hypothetical protein